MHITEFLDWVKLMDNYFNYMEILEDKQIKIVAYKLVGGASAW